jgi:two-component system, OmpR family, alkaline phosphatase synthesis response regulator PhoP
MAKKILIVDDEFLIRKVLSFLMEEQGYEVTLAKDGADCFEVLKDFTPDLIFLDIMMPKTDGRDICRELRKDERFKDTKILMLTASGEYVANESWIAIGADGYVAKPFSPSKILEAVKKFIG